MLLPAAETPLEATLECFTRLTLEDALSRVKRSLHDMLGLLPSVLWGQHADGERQLQQQADTSTGLFFFKILGAVAPDTVIRYLSMLYQLEVLASLDARLMRLKRNDTAFGCIHAFFCMYLTGRCTASSGR